MGGAFSIWHWVIVLVIVLILFGGRGKISTILGDLGKGIRSFKHGLTEEEPSQINEQVKDQPETTDAEKADPDTKQG